MWFLTSRGRQNFLCLISFARFLSPPQKGFDEGFKQGALEVAREIACRLRDIGWPPERIQEVTGLSGEELKKLFPDEQ